MTTTQMGLILFAIFIGILANFSLFELGYHRSFEEKKLTKNKYRLLIWLLPFYIFGYNFGLRSENDNPQE